MNATLKHYSLPLKIITIDSKEIHIMSNKSEDKIPKAYYYSVDGVLDDEGNLKKFSIPSYGRDVDDEFDLEGIGNTTALSFYLDNEEYRDLEKWPLLFKFYKTLRSVSIDLEMNLSYAPCFLSTPKKIVVTKEAATPAPKPKRQRKVKEVQDETTVQDQVSEQEVSDSSNDVSE